MVARLEGRLAGQSERLLVLLEVLVVPQLAELLAEIRTIPSVP